MYFSYDGVALQATAPAAKRLSVIKFCNAADKQKD
jgi:hypothetical protein